MAVCIAPRRKVSSISATTRPDASADQHELEQAGNSGRNARLEIAHAGQQHRANRQQHEQRAQQEGDRDFTREFPRRQAKAQTLTIGHFQVARHEYEAHQQDQHAHAAGDARELRILEQR